MDENIELILEDARENMAKSIEHLKYELHKVRAGKANTAMLDGVKVEYYGSSTPLNQVASVSIADSRTITISPWEKKLTPTIERAIMEANLGFNPQSDGEMIRIHIPSLTEDRRKELVKQAKNEGEQAKIALRSIRHDSLHKLKELQKDGVSEDEVKTGEKNTQEITNEFTSQVDEILKMKEEEIMTV